MVCFSLPLLVTLLEMLEAILFFLGVGVEDGRFGSTSLLRESACFEVVLISSNFVHNQLYFSGVVSG